MGMDESVTGIPSGEVTPGTLIESSGRGTTNTPSNRLLAYTLNINHETRRGLTSQSLAGDESGSVKESSNEAKSGAWAGGGGISREDG